MTQNKKTHLNIENTTVNRNKIAYTVAHHIVTECMTDAQIRNMAIQHLEDGYNETNYSIPDLVEQVKTTKVKENNADFYPEMALHFGIHNYQEAKTGNAYFFYVASRDYHSNIVKETEVE